MEAAVDRSQQRATAGVVDMLAENLDPARHEPRSGSATVSESCRELQRQQGPGVGHGLGLASASLAETAAMSLRLERSSTPACIRTARKPKPRVTPGLTGCGTSYTPREEIGTSPQQSNIRASNRQRFMLTRPVSLSCSDTASGFSTSSSSRPRA